MTPFESYSPKQRAILAIVTRLADGYPNQTMTKHNLHAYVQDLADLPAEAVAQAAAHLRRSSEFLPSIAKIRETTEAIMKPPQPLIPMFTPEREPTEAEWQVGRNRVREILASLNEKMGRSSEN